MIKYIIIYANNEENKNYHYKFVSIDIERCFMDILVGVYILTLS